jgi:hypothetical protein
VVRTEALHCASAIKRFLSLSKASAVAESMEVFSAQHTFLKEAWPLQDHPAATALLVGIAVSTFGQ